MVKDTFEEIFGKLPIIGMVHLAGKNETNRVKRALEEIQLYEDHGLDGIIVENYHGEISDVKATLKELSHVKTNLSIGVNILPNNFDLAYQLVTMYHGDFIQLDHVAGHYVGHGSIDEKLYATFRNSFPDTVVLGGVWPKYYQPFTGSDIINDVQTGMQRADAIVVTGAGTGKETPLHKIKDFKRITGGFPLIVGAGLTAENACTQLTYADGAIVGSYFKKDSETQNPLDEQKLEEFMGVVRRVRLIKYS